jgi:hypothetical protein
VIGDSFEPRCLGHGVDVAGASHFIHPRLLF